MTKEVIINEESVNFGNEDIIHIHISKYKYIYKFILHLEKKLARTQNPRNSMTHRRRL